MNSIVDYCDELNIFTVIGRCILVIKPIFYSLIAPRDKHEKLLFQFTSKYTIFQPEKLKQLKWSS